MFRKILLTAISVGALLLLLFLITGHSTPKDLDERAEEALEYCKDIACLLTMADTLAG